MNTWAILCLLGATSTGPWLVELGASKQVLERALSDYQPVQWLEARTPQALRKGLIESRLLETLNKYEAAPKTADGAFDSSVIGTVVTAERSGRKYTWILSPGGALRFALVRVPVPVDRSADPQGGWSRARLGALDRALDELGSVTPIKKDPRGNVFQWKRTIQGGELRAWYLPEQDELRILVWAR